MDAIRLSEETTDDHLRLGHEKVVPPTKIGVSNIAKEIDPRIIQRRDDDGYAHDN